MKAILIDAVNKTVTEVEKGEGIQDIYKHLKCDTFDVVGLGGGVDCFVDDEGLLKEGYVDEDGTKHNMHGFRLRGYDQVLMGNGLILGHNGEGETIDSPVTVKQVQEVVTFVEYDRPEDKPQPFMQVVPWNF